MNHESHENHADMGHSGHDMAGQNDHSMADMSGHSASGHSGGHGVSVIMYFLVKTIDLNDFDKTRLKQVCLY